MFTFEERISATLMIRQGMQNRDILKKLKSKIATQNDVAVLRHWMKNLSRTKIERIKQGIVMLQREDIEDVKKFINELPIL